MFEYAVELFEVVVADHQLAGTLAGVSELDVSAEFAGQVLLELGDIGVGPLGFSGGGFVTRLTDFFTRNIGCRPADGAGLRHDPRG